jgi:hypothetical protein
MEPALYAVACLEQDKRNLKAEIERLRAALAALISDIEEYERVNNLAPSPGKQDCWQTVTQAKAALRSVQVPPPA